MKRVFLGLGSNIGDRRAELQRAVKALPDVVNISPIYETEPLGGPSGQQPYFNCVVELHTERSAQELLTLIGELEAVAGRVRIEKNGPRTLDVDILLVGNETINEPGLTVPHPRMWQRRFVLQPLFDIAPDLLPEGWETDAAGQVEYIGPLHTGGS